MPLLSLAHLTMLDATPYQIIRAAAGAGFDAVSLRLFSTMNETAQPFAEMPALLSETLAVMADTGIKVLDIEALFIRPETRPSHYERGFESASKLGARIIQSASFDPDEARMVDNFADLCRLAASFDLVVGLEPMAFSPINSVAKALHVIDKAQAGNGRLIIDALHAHRCGEDFRALGMLPPGSTALFQLCDASAAAPVGRDAQMQEGRADRKLPGDGQIDLATLWKSLPTGLPVGLETPLGPAYGTLSFGERARLIKASTDRFFRSFDGQADLAARGLANG